MSTVTIWFGLGLVVLGIASYVGSGGASVTALIPVFFGAILAGLGAAAARDVRRPLMMHLAVLVALLGFLGSAPGLFDLPDLFAGRDVDRPWAIGAQSAMALALAVYIGLAVRSFVAARRTRTTAAG